MTIGITATWLADGGEWQPLGLVATGIALIGLMRLAGRHGDEYEAHLRADGATARQAKPDPLGLRRGYLMYQAGRAGMPARRAMTLAWGAWLLPLGFVAVLWIYAMLDLSLGAVRT
ncbi:hypothetical protein [Actinotalea sp. C106]|uniref:hypothetical protein n=1 Tax=Actinotalea sp. C106 TaxID=2908644 RepID=UPI0020299108|nr:hypothetical protein [Actinotalea sp. C106]